MFCTYRWNFVTSLKTFCISLYQFIFFLHAEHNSTCVRHFLDGLIRSVGNFSLCTIVYLVAF